MGVVRITSAGFSRGIFGFLRFFAFLGGVIRWHEAVDQNDVFVNSAQVFKRYQLPFPPL